MAELNQQSWSQKTCYSINVLTHCNLTKKLTAEGHSHPERHQDIPEYPEQEPDLRTCYYINLCAQQISKPYLLEHPHMELVHTLRMVVIDEGDFCIKVSGLVSLNISRSFHRVIPARLAT